MKKALKRQGSPEPISTDGLRSYRAAMKNLGNEEKQEVGRWAPLHIGLVFGLMEPVRLARVANHLGKLAEQLETGVEFQAQRHRHTGVLLAVEHQHSCVDGIEVANRRGAIEVGGFQDGKLGRLKAGYLADLTVLDTNLRTAPPESLKQAGALRTIMGGRERFDRS
jgi:nitroreductase